jgi:hypothetical protein
VKNIYMSSGSETLLGHRRFLANRGKYGNSGLLHDTWRGLLRFWEMPTISADVVFFGGLRRTAHDLLGSAFKVKRQHKVLSEETQKESKQARIDMSYKRTG